MSESRRRIYPINTISPTGYRLMRPRKVHTCAVCFRPIARYDGRPAAAWMRPAWPKLADPRQYVCQHGHPIETGMEE